MKKGAKAAKAAITDFFPSKPPAKGKASAASKMDVEDTEEVKKDEEIKPAKSSGVKDSFGLLPYDEFADDLGSWKPFLKKFAESKKFKSIYDFIKGEYSSKTVYPPADQIFNAFKLTPLSKLKVVIVGQDPYINEKQAMGLCFSVPRGTTPPPSLKNIFNCIKNDSNIKGFKVPNHGDLTKWAQQGVFLLNNILTVVAGKSDSHKGNGWEEFTDEVISLINTECDKIIFMLWGLPAQKKAKIVNENKHYVLKTSHPSPLSASRGFLTSGHFSEVNKILKNIGKDEIDWNLD